MFFNNIKLNYNIKILDDLIKSKDYESIHQLILSKKNNKNLFYHLIRYIRNNYFHLPDHSRMLKKKFIWLTSFENSDLTFIDNFIQFYLKNQNLTFLSDSYTNCYSQTMEKIGIKELNPKPSFDEIILETDLYHLLIHYMNNEEYFILKSNSAFFEAPNNKFFIYPNNTITYFAVIRNPYELYSQYKIINNSQEEALEKLNYFDISKVEKNNANLSQKYSLMEVKQSWSINAKSWNDENVKDTYRGKIILYSNLFSSPEESLIEIIYHLKQCGLPLEVDYKMINNFLSQNVFEKEQKVLEMSNQELKLVSNGLDKNLLEDLNFQSAN